MKQYGVTIKRISGGAAATTSHQVRASRPGLAADRGIRYWRIGAGDIRKGQIIQVTIEVLE